MKVHSETTSTIEVPPDYSEEMWSETVEDLTNTTSDLDELYTILHRIITEYRKE